MIAILVFNKMGKYIYLSIYLGREHDCHFGFNKMGKSVYLSIYQIWTGRISNLDKKNHPSVHVSFFAL